MGYVLITANRNYSSWSLRPWALMTALGIPFEERIELFTAANNWEAFRAFSPSGQVPVLVDGSRTIWDSLGITLYLAERHDGVWPRDESARAWAMCAVTEMHGGFSALRTERMMSVGVRAAPHPASSALDRDISRIKELWAEGLDRFGGPWLAGDRFTAVDAFYAPVAFRVRTFGIDVGDVGSRWCESLFAHPAIKAWEAAALAETWREPAHEDEMRACGTIFEDHRAL